MNDKHRILADLCRAEQWRWVFAIFELSVSRHTIPVHYRLIMTIL